MPTREYQISVTSDGSGDATVFSRRLTGRIQSIAYTRIDFAQIVDFTISAESSGTNVWTESNVDADKTVSPCQPSHDQAGNPAVYVEAGEAVLTPIHLVKDRLKFVIKQAGSNNTGTFVVVVVD